MDCTGDVSTCVCVYSTCSIIVLGVCRGAVGGAGLKCMMCVFHWASVTTRSLVF